MAVAAPVTAATVVFLVWWLWPRADVGNQPMGYFYDLNTKELFEAPAAPGPLETASGPYKGQMAAGVRAHVYCCGPYRKGSEKFIGYLEVPYDSVPEADRPPGFVVDPELEGAEVLIRRVDDEMWYSAISPEGLKIKQEVGQRCGPRQRLTYVTPVPR